jgi:pantoate--beta-alanine ligase
VAVKIVRSPRALQTWSMTERSAGRRVGFVPTMGALHAGHASLIARARRECDRVVVSIFVNPTQFGPTEDLSRYPRPFARDRRLCREAGVDVLFAPVPDAIYPAGDETWVSVEQLSQPLCGAFRPGHFRGVTTVVAKLFNIVQPSRAYFGEKDFQQLRVIQRMVSDLHMPVRVVPCPTRREASDGLALSSRNAYLSPSERSSAAAVPAALRAAEEVIKSRPGVASSTVASAARNILRRIPGARVQYVEVVDPETLQPLSRVHGRALVALAVVVGKTRLIDNRLVGKFPLAKNPFRG